MADVNRTELGDALRQAREAAGLTLAAASTAAGGKPSDRSISQWENGRHRPPRWAVELLEQLYRVPDHRLLAKAGYVLGLDEWQQSVEDRLNLLAQDYLDRTGQQIGGGAAAVGKATARRRVGERRRQAGHE